MHHFVKNVWSFSNFFGNIRSACEHSGNLAEAIFNACKILESKFGKNRVRFWSDLLVRSLVPLFYNNNDNLLLNTVVISSCIS